MLSWSLILERIKDELSLPFQVLEKTDEDIIKYLKSNCVRKFSTYFPVKNKILLDSSNPNTKRPDRQSEFFLIDPDDREILTVVDFIENLGSYVIAGHSPYGAFTFGAVPEISLQNYMGNNLRPFSQYEHTFEFSAPNIIRISPKFSGTATIEYERTIDPELSDINPELQDYFMELCIAMTFQMIGRIRQKYSNIQTPYGQIELDGQALKSEGDERYNAVIQEMKTGSMPNVIFSRG